MRTATEEREARTEREAKTPLLLFGFELRYLVNSFL